MVMIASSAPWAACNRRNAAEHCGLPLALEWKHYRKTCAATSDGLSRFATHQLRLDELYKNFSIILKTCSAPCRRVGQLPQAVMRKRGCALSSTTQVSRSVANAPVSMLIRFGNTSGRSLGVCP